MDVYKYKDGHMQQDPSQCFCVPRQLLEDLVTGTYTVRNSVEIHLRIVANVMTNM